MDRSLATEWDGQADDWIRWARTPDHDSYWVFHRERFLDLVPDAGRLTLDVGCGEGRVGRDLAERGHAVVGVDASQPLVEACVRHENGHDAVVGNAASLPVADGAVDLVVGFMSFQDLDDLAPAISEARRVLDAEGSIHLAIVHPLNSAGGWRHSDASDTSDSGDDADFVISDAYLQASRYADSVARDGLTMTFHGMHRPLSAYTDLLADNGLVITRLAEVTDPDPASKWARIPLFLHIVAAKR